MKQTPATNWPKGLSFQLAALDDENLEKLNLTYEAYWEDGLGLHFVAICETKEGTFAISRGVDQPSPGVLIRCYEDGAAVSDRLQAFFGHFGLTEESLVWRTPFKFASSDAS